jgi:hypothetical protein
MTPEEAPKNILKLVEGSDELEDTHAQQILLQSIKTLARREWGARIDASKFHVHAVAYRGGMSMRFDSVRRQSRGASIK